eukprot:g922.t1
MPIQSQTGADPVFDGLLALHIVSGFLALTIGAAVMALAKGDRRHRQVGRAFAWTMTAAVASALALAVLRANPFLLAIGLFSAYLLGTGWRAMAHGRRTRSRLAAARAERMAGAIGLALAAGLLTGAAVAAADGAWTQAAPLAVFGIGLAAAGRSDLAAGRRGGATPPERTARHIQRMGGAWIASLTAFAVVNLTMLPELAAWLGPAALISPLIAHWVRRHAPRAPHERA